MHSDMASEENLIAFVSHNYAVETAKRIIVNVSVGSAVIILMDIIGSLLNTEHRVGFWDFFIWGGITSLMLLVIIYVKKTSINKQSFLKIHLLCLLMITIIMDVSLMHLGSKYISAKAMCIIGFYVFIITVTSLLVSSRYYIKWVNDGLYRKNADIIKKIDEIHTKIWYKDSYFSSIGICAFFVIKWITGSAIFLLLAILSITPFFIVDISKYYLQLKYAKKYNLREYLPQEPQVV